MKPNVFHLVTNHQKQHKTVLEGVRCNSFQQLLRSVTGKRPGLSCKCYRISHVFEKPNFADWKWLKCHYDEVKPSKDLSSFAGPHWRRELLSFSIFIVSPREMILRRDSCLCVHKVLFTHSSLLDRSRTGSTFECCAKWVVSGKEKLGQVSTKTLHCSRKTVFSSRGSEKGLGYCDMNATVF